MTALLAHDGADHFFLGLLAAVLVGLYGLASSRQRQTSSSRQRRTSSSQRRTATLRHHSSQAWRLAAWIGGVAIVLAASTPWFEALAEESFTGHMVQHLLVIIVAAPLLVLAQPVHTLGGAGWLPLASRLGPTGRRLATRWRTWAPVLCPLLFVVVLFVTHLTAIYDVALGDRVLHEAEHAAYLLAAVLTWSAVLSAGRRGAPARVAAVFGVGAGGALLGMILLAAPEPLIPTYEAQLGTERALSDQRSAAALMWVGGMLTTVPLLLLAVWRWASTEERVTRRAEALRAAPSRPDPRPVERSTG